MKRMAFLLLGLALVFGACNKDDDDDNSAQLSYDGENATAPILPAGAHEYAARFTADELTPYVGKNLLEVTFFLGNLPENCTVKVYGQGTATAPGALLYSASVSNSLQAPGWNTHEVRGNVQITGDDLWLSIAVTHSANQQSVGCDAGPGNPDGDWLLLDAGTTDDWTTYQQLANESINWNIRGRVSN